MNIKLTDGRVRSWGLHLGGYFMCKNCKVVDRDTERMQAGYKCSACGKEGDGARLYFHVNIHVILDLLEESYSSTPEDRFDDRVASKHVNVLLLFCALKEALLINLIRHLLIVKRIPPRLQDRLMKDSRQFNASLNKLLPDLIACKWQEALQEVGVAHRQDFCGLDRLLRDTGKLRNRFLHNASPWDISEDLCRECIDSLANMFQLFVALHNRYVHSEVLDRL